MSNGLKIKTNSTKCLSLVGGAAIAAATLALTGTALPASAASITYSTWANIGPQRIGDADNGKFTLKVTDGKDFGDATAGKVLFQFQSFFPELEANKLISEVYFNDASGLFKTTTTGTKTTYNAAVSTAYSTSVNGLNLAYNPTTTLPQGNSIGLSKPTFSFNKTNSSEKNGCKGNDCSISRGETLGIFVDLVDGKNFNSVLNALTQTNGLIVAAHIIGYPNPDDSKNGLSDTFYYGNSGLTTTPPAGTDSAIFYDGYQPPTNPNPNPAPGQAVPEPLTILGAATAAGFGASFKRRLAKVKGNQKAD